MVQLKDTTYRRGASILLFQFLMVQLKGNVRDAKFIWFKRISIPNGSIKSTG